MSQPGTDPWAVVSDAAAAPDDPWAVANDSASTGWAPSEDQAREAVMGIAPGATITSQARTPEHNAKIGGVPNSMHLGAQATDIVLPKGMTAAQLKAQLIAQGYPVTEFLDEGTHVHWGWGPKGANPGTVSADPWAPVTPNDGHWHNTPQENSDLDAFEALGKGQPPTANAPLLPHPDQPETSWGDMALGAFAPLRPSAYPQFGVYVPKIIGTAAASMEGGIGGAIKGVADYLTQKGAVSTDTDKAIVGGIRNFGQMLTDHSQKYLQENAPNVPAGSAKAIAYEGMNGMVSTLPAIVLSGLTDSPTPFLAQIGATSFGNKFNEEIKKNPSDPQGALNSAVAAGSIDTGAAYIGWKAFGIQPFTTTIGKITNDLTGEAAKVTQQTIADVIKNVTLQGVAIQPAISVVSQAAQNVANGIPIMAGLPQAYLTGAIQNTLTLGLLHLGTKPKPVLGTVEGGGRSGSGMMGDGTVIDQPPQGGAPAPENAPAPSQNPAGPVHAAVRSALGLDRPGVAPTPDPWEPIAEGTPALPTPRPSPQAAAVEGPGIPRRALESDVAVTSTGREVPVQYAVVEASHLVPSQTQEGNPNPAFPAELQPRDRTRAVSQAQIATIAQNINPRLLDRSVNASDGAPIVAPSGVVESGNGRSLAIQRAYADNLPSAQAYRDYLAERGYPVEGMDQPVLVRIRTDTMAPDDRQAFVREANQSGQLGYSATERAMSDAAAMPDHSLELFRGGDVESAANRDFVRSFMQHAMPANEHAAMVDTNGNLSLDGARRVRAALLAKAYADPDLVGNIVENSDNSIKAIGNALTDSAPDWAMMRAGVARGEIPPSLDQTGKLLEAVRLVARARADGRNVAEFVGQPDIFTGQSIDPDTEAWLRLMFRNTKDWTKPVGRDNLAEALQFYAREAQKAQVGPSLLGDQPVSPQQILAVAKAKQYGEQPSGTGPSLSFGEDVRAHGFEGDRSSVEGASASGSEGNAPLSTARLAEENELGPTVNGFRPESPIAFNREQSLSKDVTDFANQAGVSPRDLKSAAGALANYILLRGHRTGTEAVAYRHANGQIGAHSFNMPSQVFFGSMIGYLRDPASRMVTIHNHPSGSAPSRADIESLGLPGHEIMAVVGHSGGWYMHRLAAEVSGSPDQVQKALFDIAHEVDTEIFRHLDVPFKSGAITGDEAHSLHGRLISEALDRAGITDYVTNVPARNSRIQPVIDAALKEGANVAIAKAKSGNVVKPSERSDRIHRPAGPLGFGDGIALLSERPTAGLGGTAIQDGAGGSGRNSGAPYKKPEQLRLLEDDKRYPDLIIQHNLSTEKLMHADRMGGIPAPSLAITKAEHPSTSFGDITLLGPKEMADPKSGTKVFGADIYSPRYPEISYKLDAPALKKINAILAPYREAGEREIYGAEINRPDDLRGNSAFERYVKAQNPGEKYPDYRPYAKALLEEAGAQKRLFRGFTNSGSRSYKPHTLENVLKILKKDLRGGEGFNYGVGSLRAHYTPEFKSVKAIKENSGRLMAKENFDKVKDEIDNNFWSIANDLQPYSQRGKEFGFGDAVIGAMADAKKMGLRRALDEWQIKGVPDDILKDAATFLEKLRHLSTEYFEAKILRGVGVQEFTAAVVPHDAPAKVRQMLERRGIHVSDYQRNDLESRRQAIAAAAQEHKTLFEDRPRYDEGSLREEENRYERDRPPFYSALTRAIEDTKMSRAPAKDWAGLIDNLRAKGVKQEEIDWSGVKDWLGQQSGAVTRDQVLQHLRDNEVQVQEIERGSIDERKSGKEKMAELRPAMDEMVERHGRFGFDEKYEARRAIISEPDSWDYDTPEDRRLAHEYSRAAKAGGSEQTKYSKYTLPGGENYRELLMTLPLSKRTGEWRVEGQGPGTYLVNDANGVREFAGTYGAAQAEALKRNGGGYRSSHWDEPNILAHVRFDDRQVIAPGFAVENTRSRNRSRTFDTREEAQAYHASLPESVRAGTKIVDAQVPKKVLHVAEVQSDWHQAGRRKGYVATPEEVTKLRAEAQRIEKDIANRDVRALDNSDGKEWRDSPERRAMVDQLVAVRRRAAGEGVPDAPFKSSWHELAAKRMLRYAAEHGYDRLSWDTGETQEQRYWGNETVAPAVDRWREVTKPDNIGKLAENIFGRKMATVMPLDVVDGGVLAALHHDQIRRAVIAALPVGVVNDLASVKVTPEQFFRNPDMAVSSLSADALHRVANGTLDATRKTAALLRAKLESLKTAGTNPDLLPTLRASDLSAREVAGLLDPERLFHRGAAGSPEEGAATRPGTEMPRSVSTKLGSTALADALNHHAAIVHGEAGLLQHGFQTPPGEGQRGFYDKILPNTVNKLAKKFGARVEAAKIGTKGEVLDVVASDGSLIDRTVFDSRAHAIARENPGSKVIQAAVDVPTHSVPITDEMRKSVMQGQPLFEEKNRYGDDKQSAFRAEIERRRADRVALVDHLTKAMAKDGRFSAKSATGNRTNLLTRGTEDAKYRVTTIDDLGPSGHRDYNSIDEAAQEFMGSEFAHARPFSTEPGAIDGQGRALPQTIMPGAEPSAAQLAKAREAAAGGKMATKVGQKPPGGLFGAQDVPGQDRLSLFEDGRRYGEIPRDDRETLEKAARTGDWIGKYGAEGATPDARIRNAIGRAFVAWRRTGGSVPAVVRSIFGRMGGGGGRGNGGGGGGFSSGFEDVPTSRPTEAFSEKVKRAAAATMDLVHDAQMLIAPMAEGTNEARATAKDFANMMRLARYHGNRMMESLKKNFDHNQRRRMWEAADEESVLRQKGEPTAGRGLSRLTPEERRAVLEQQADAQNVWQAAKDQGMVRGDGLPSYVPRMMVEMGRTGVGRLGGGDAEVRSIPGIGRNLKTKTGQMKHRKYTTTEETEAAGSAKFGTVANVVKDIQTLPLATMKLREAVAGRALINKIKEIGQKTGDDTVVEGHEPTGTPYKWFTLDNPAFKTWRPKLIKNEESGKYEPAKDQNGDIVFEKVPLFVRGDFEGPLRAILSQDSGKVYNALMNMKGRAMTAIMYSPLIHNAVEWGRALPAMPGKVATFRIYFEGNRAKRDPEQMTEAIMHGLVPIGHQAGMQDITSIANPESIKAGRSWTAKIVGAVPGLFSRDAQQTVYRTIDRMGDLWHNTLLWDRVGDLQMGLYTNFRDHLIAKGNSPDTAAYVAAHFANRYAGALPLESMSNMSRKLANLALFSRTYTLGNLGAMKDVITGLPRDVQAQIARDGTVEQLKGVRSMAARKALAILVTDIALFYIINSILQSAVSLISGRQDLSEIEKGYVDRLKGLLSKVTESPMELLNPFGDLQALSATSENEPGRQNRVLVGYDRDGTAIYARNPVGKIGEEFTNWLSSPLETLKAKFSTVLRPTWQTLTNDAGFGRQVYDPKAKGLSGLVTNIGHVVSLYLSSQVPLDSLKSAAAMLKGGGSEIDTYKALGPLAGVTFSKGAGGGPGVGELYDLRRQRDAKQAAVLPGAIEKIKRGDIAGARADMRSVGISPGLQNYYVRVTQNPRLRLNTRSARELLRQATPEERARILQPAGAQ